MVSLHQRLMRAFMIMLSMLLVMGGVGLVGNLATTSTTEQLISRVEPMRLNNAQVDALLVEASRGVRGFILTRQPRLLEQFTLASQRVPQLLQEQRSMARGVENTLLDQQAQAVEAWLAWQGTAADIQKRYPPGKPLDEQRFVESTRLFDLAQQTIQRLDESLAAQQQSLRQQVGVMRAAGLVTMLGLGVLSSVLALWLVRRLSRSVSRPLASTVDALDRLAQGDVTVRVPEDPDGTPAVAEVAVVARSVNALAASAGLEQQRQAQRAWARQRAREIGQAARGHLEVSAITLAVVQATASALQAKSVGMFLLEQGRLVRHRLWYDQVMIPTPLQAQTASAESANSTHHHDPDVVAAPQWLYNLYTCRLAWLGSSMAKDLLDHQQGRLDDSEHAPAVTHGLAELQVGQVLEISQQLAHVMAAGWADVSVGDYQPLTPEQAAEGGYDPWCAVAFGEGSTPQGLLVVELPPGRLWTESLAEFMHLVAADVGQALHHACLYAQRGQVIAQLEQLDKAKSEFLATTSHELRTPLTSICGYTEMLSDQPMRTPDKAGEGLTPDQHAMVEVLHRNATRLRGMIDDLLTLSRLDAGAAGPALAPVSLEHVVRRVAGLVPPLLESKGLRLRAEVGPVGLMVWGDLPSLERALLNVLSNAIKFSHEGGQVQMKVQREGDQAVVQVIDHGIGIPKEEQQQLFTRFFRASNATAAAVPGTGLGLNIVAAIVAHHHGTVDVQSQEGQGTTITFRLPVAEATQAELPAQSTGTHDTTAHTHSSND